jgi:hypothetical protein
MNDWSRGGWMLMGSRTGRRRAEPPKPGSVVRDKDGNVTVYAPPARWGAKAKTPGGKE